MIVVLDTSLSMAAEDVAPNRLDQARHAIESLLGRLEGDRVGLVTFAGQATLTCPLTVDGIPCGRRVGTLYLPSGMSYFGCRHCYNLSYKSRNKAKHGPLSNFSRLMAIEERYIDLHGQIKRWTYRGQHTRKARQLSIL